LKSSFGDLIRVRREPLRTWSVAGTSAIEVCDSSRKIRAQTPRRQKGNTDASLQEQQKEAAAAESQVEQQTQADEDQSD